MRIPFGGDTTGLGQIRSKSQKLHKDRWTDPATKEAQAAETQDAQAKKQQTRDQIFTTDGFRQSIRGGLLEAFFPFLYGLVLLPT